MLAKYWLFQLMVPVDVDDTYERVGNRSNSTTTHGLYRCP